MVIHGHGCSSGIFPPNVYLSLKNLALRYVPSLYKKRITASI